MSKELENFVAALENFVRVELTSVGAEEEYCHDAVQIVDARNLLFRNVGQHSTDEVENIYALRELCRIDEESFALVPDEGRIRAIARNVGLL